MFTCTKCSTYPDQSSFGGWPRNKWCKACSAEYQRNLRAEGYKPSGRNKALAANRAKGDLSREDFLLMCDSVVRLAQD